MSGGRGDARRKETQPRVEEGAHPEKRRLGCSEGNERGETSKGTRLVRGDGLVATRRELQSYVYRDLRPCLAGLCTSLSKVVEENVLGTAKAVALAHADMEPVLMVVPAGFAHVERATAKSSWKEQLASKAAQTV